MSFDYDQLDAGIRETVRRINGWGFRTTDSGDGSKAATMECALDVPNVFIEVSPLDLVRETNRLRDLLARAGVLLNTVGFGGARIQSSYDPVDGSAVIELYGVDDRSFA